MGNHVSIRCRPQRLKWSIYPLAAILFTASSLLALPLSWTGAGGDGSWHNPANWSGGFLPTATNDVVISVAGTPTITFSTGQTIVRSIQCDEAFVLAGGALTVTAGVTAFNGPVTLGSAGSMTVDGAGASLTINGPLVRCLSNLTARRGSQFRLPTLTTLTLTNDTLSFSSYDAGTLFDISNLTNIVSHADGQIFLYAYSGSVLDAHQLNNPPGPFYAYATTGARVDLSALNGRLINPGGLGFKLEAGPTGALALPNVTALDGVDLVIRAGGQVPTAQLKELVRGTLALYGTTNDFGGLTNLFEANVDLHSGARFAPAGINRLVISNSSALFTVHDAATVLDLSNVTNLVADPRFSLSAWAYSGGRIDLKRLPKPSAVLDIYAEGANSVVDLSQFSGALNPSPAGSILSRFGGVSGGSILISNVTSMDRVKLELRNGGKIPTAQLTSLTRGTLTVYSTTNTFVGMTNLDGTTIDVRQAARVFFPAVRSLSGGTGGFDISARDNGTWLDLSSVTNLSNPSAQVLAFSTYTGGRIDLHALPRPVPGLYAYADGPGAAIDFSGFAGRISTPIRITLEVRNNGSIQMPNVTELDGVDVAIRSNGQLATAQLTQLTRARLSVYGSTNNFASLRSIQDTDVEVRSGARLVLPGISTLLITNGSVQFTARDAGSVLDLSSVTNVTVAPAAGLYISAVTGGFIDLRNVARFTEGLVQVLATDPGSAVNLSALRSFICPNQNSSLRTLAGGNILLGTEPCVVGNAAVDLCASSQLPTPFAAARSFVVVHGQAWRSYLIEVRPAGLSNAPWQFFSYLPMTNSFQTVGWMPQGSVEFRVQEFVANPSFLDMNCPSNGWVNVVLYGTPGKTYQLQTTTSAVPPLTWEAGSTIAMTNSFRLLPRQTRTPSMLFFRAREM